MFSETVGAIDELFEDKTPGTEEFASDLCDIISEGVTEEPSTAIAVFTYAAAKLSAAELEEE